PPLESDAHHLVGADTFHEPARYSDVLRRLVGEPTIVGAAERGVEHYGHPVPKRVSGELGQTSIDAPGDLGRVEPGLERAGRPDRGRESGERLAHQVGGVGSPTETSRERPRQARLSRPRK